MKDKSYGKSKSKPHRKKIKVNDLHPKHSQMALNRKIKKLINEGYSQDQAVAIAHQMLKEGK